MNDMTFLFRWVMDKAEEAPLADRIRITRGLSEVCGHPDLAKELAKHADELERAHRLCREFVFSFSQKTSGGQ